MHGYTTLTAPSSPHDATRLGSVGCTAVAHTAPTCACSTLEVIFSAEASPSPGTSEC